MTGSLGIVELVGVCADWRRQSLEAFEVTGRWARTLTDPPAQRLFAEASHRHAWHADLWSERSPTIAREPETGVGTNGADPNRWSPDDATARAAYHDRVVAMLAELDALASRIDVDLDPATLRTIALVRADLIELGDRSA